MKQKIVIVGGGFGGINIIKQLANDHRFDITLVDKNNYHFFPPLIYQVGSSILEPSAISYPFRKFLRGKNNVHFRIGELIEINSSEKKIILSNGEVEYDTLILGTGTKSNYFGMENIEKYAISMKTLNDSLLLKNTILERIEQAYVEKDPIEKEKLLSIVIVGGGPAGVEIAGVLAEIMEHITPIDFRELTSKIKIYLIEGVPNLLGAMSERSHKVSYEALVKLGIKVLLNTQVKDCDENSIYFANGEKIDTKTIIWTAGVIANTFQGLPQEVYGRGKRMVVDEYNQLIGHDSIYVIGDTCIMTKDTNFPNGHPQLAQVAIQQGINLAKNIKRELSGHKKQGFYYKDRGSMAIIGRNKAVADLKHPTLFLKGFFAWLIWSGIHLISLVSVGNKMNTMYRWMVIYIFKTTSLGVNYRIGETTKRTNKNAIKL